MDNLPGTGPEPLRVLIATEREERLQTTTELVAAMGHHVIARELEVTGVAAATFETTPDIALIGLVESTQHTLGLISRIVQEAACPVIATFETNDPEFLNEAADRGVFASVSEGDPDQLRSALDIALRRLAELHRFEGGLGRSAMSEQAKGILMERRSIDERAAFELLRSHSRRTGRTLIDIAEAVCISHLLLDERPKLPTQDSRLTDGRIDETPGAQPEE